MTGHRRPARREWVTRRKNRKQVRWLRWLATPLGIEWCRKVRADYERCLADGWLSIEKSLEGMSFIVPNTSMMETDPIGFPLFVYPNGSSIALVGMANPLRGAP